MEFGDHLSSDNGREYTGLSSDKSNQPFTIILASLFSYMVCLSTGSALEQFRQDKQDLERPHLF